MKRTWALAATLALLSAATPLIAQEEEKNSSVLDQIRELQDEAKNLGPWESEAHHVNDAHRQIFQRNGWDSEPDQFMLNLMNQVTQVAPWDAQKREDIFVTGLQNRLGLSQDQLDLMRTEMRTESMRVTSKHMLSLLPVAVEIANTRRNGEPFTAAQVQKWSAKFEPVIADAKEAIQRVSQKLEQTMTPAQKAMMQTDLEAFLKRHHDVEQMVERWKEGKWNPTDWGLDNDPIHANAMYEYRMQQAEKDGLVELARLKEKPDLTKTAQDENEWERYVLWFCNFYKCDDVQRSTAKGILNKSIQEATNYINARGKELAALEQKLEAATTDAERQRYTSELERLRKPIGLIFDRMCARLENNVLASSQRKLLPPKKKTQTRRASATPKTPGRSAPAKGDSTAKH